MTFRTFTVVNAFFTFVESKLAADALIRSLATSSSAGVKVDVVVYIS